MDQVERIEQARVLIVDDHRANVLLLESILRRSGFTTVRGTTDPAQAVPLFLEMAPDIVLLDLHMPGIDGYTLLARLRVLSPVTAPVPVVVLTADATAEAKQRVLSGGAKDFLTKPFDSAEVVLRIRNLLETRFLQLWLQEDNRMLEERVLARTQDLEAAHNEIVERLAIAAEYRDDDTGQHTHRVGRMAALLAEALGMAPDVVALIRRAAPLHDVGKIGIPDDILHKPARLSDSELDRMRTHTTIGAKIVLGGSSPLMRVAEEVAISHHERWDGSGYPHGLSGEDIPLSGRIVAVADVFDALTHARPYKEAWPAERAIAEITRQRGSQFDPRVVDAFDALVRRDAEYAIGSALQAAMLVA